MAECLANHAEGTYPCGHIRLRKRLSQRYEADRLAQFQSIMVDQEPFMELWQKARKRETAVSEVAG
jgi:hypothetical protein